MNWHQDLHIGVKKRIESPGFGNWSVKNGILHVQPPVEYLARMLTVRIHLDDCLAQDGALEVLPSSHYTGVVSKKRIDELDAKGAFQVCAAKSGDVLLMLSPSCPPLIPRQLMKGNSCTSNTHPSCFQTVWSGQSLS